MQARFNFGWIGKGNRTHSAEVIFQDNGIRVFIDRQKEYPFENADRQYKPCETHAAKLIRRATNKPTPADIEQDRLRKRYRPRLVKAGDE